MEKHIKYIILGFIFWAIVDYTTAFNPYFHEWILVMPLALFVYTVYPSIFSYLIYKRKWGNKGLLLAMVTIGISYEIIICNNIGLYTLPIAIIFIPLFFIAYGLITFVPKWIVNKEVAKNKGKTITMVVVWIIMAIFRHVQNT